MRIILFYVLVLVVGYAEEETAKNVRVIVQMVEVSHETLGELMDSDFSKGATHHSRAMDLVKKGESTILDTSMLVIRDSEMAGLESISEYIYPTEYEPPGPGTTMNFFSPQERCFTAFETKNVGFFSKFEVYIIPSSSYVRMNLSPQFVRFDRLEMWCEHSDRLGEASLRMPIFEKWSLDTDLILESGKTELVSVFTPQQKAPMLSKRVMMFVRVDVLE